MNCDKFEQRLHFLLDRRRRPERDARLISHCQTCRNCRQILETQEAIFDSLELFETPRISDDFSDQVLASLQPPRPLLVRYTRLIAAVAAVVAIALVPLLWPSQTSPPKSPTQVVSRPALPDPSVPVQPKIHSEKDDAALANDYLVMLQNWTENFPQVPLDRFESVSQLPNGLYPVASSFNEAATLLRRTLPGGKRTKQQPLRSGWLINPTDRGIS